MDPTRRDKHESDRSISTMYVSCFCFSTLLIGWVLFLSRVAISTADGILQQTLDGRWSVTNQNASINIAAQVPGGIYSDLMRSGILEDIFFESNDVAYRWVANEIWTYSREFEVPENFLKKDSIIIVFYGLDTVASIKINDILVGITENMFIRYSFSIKSYLNIGTNKIDVEFKSPIIESAKRYKEEAEKRGGVAVPPDCVPTIYNGECHANHLRKMQASFSWDWGPAFLSVGIWKTVQIEAFNTAVIRDVIVNFTRPSIHVSKKTKSINSVWNTNVIVYFDETAVRIDNAKITFRFYWTNSTFTDKIFDVDVGPGDFGIEFNFPIENDNIEEWWPNGYGNQKMYRLETIFASDDEVSNKIIDIGFRTIELVQEPVDPSRKNGLTFYFRINDRPIFMKGSNWIPANILPEFGGDSSIESRETIERLLMAAKDTHMNMLRVWGGGVYESDYFYEMADKMGILIWQDFMFACSMYPASSEFLNNVDVEIRQQVRRLQHHPSIAVWAGNNENEAALRQNWYGTLKGYKQFKADYIDLYVNTIKKAVNETDTSIPYVVSSPSNGIKSEEDGYIALNPYDTKYGDIHYYNYILDSWNENIYLTPRFSSEYGFQSLPSTRTLQTATNRNISWDDDFLNHRQHHPAGYEEIKLQINRRLPKINATDSNKEFEQWVYYSQISQAMGIKVQTEKYRRKRNTLINGEGLTMGALYWQLNDVWQAPSWSSIDFIGRWKMLQYFAKDFFAPVLISPSLNSASMLSVYIISDLFEDIPYATIKMQIYNWNSFTPVHVELIPTKVGAEKSSIVYEHWLDDLFNLYNCKLTECFLHFSLINYQKSEYDILMDDSINYNYVRYREKRIVGVPDNFLFPTPLKDIVGLKTPIMNLSVSRESKNQSVYVYHITITTTSISPFVWLDSGNISGIFSENGFLQIENLKSVQFWSDDLVDVDLLRKELTVKSLLYN